MNSKITGIEECDLLLLIGTNVRYEAPVLNARILKATRKNNLKVALIGTPSDLTYEYMHLGSNPNLLSEIANDSHPFS
jgi:NADH dehydrogenase (ubiquinone) Fe-S protein 1